MSVLSAGWDNQLLRIEQEEKWALQIRVYSLKKKICYDALR